MLIANVYVYSLEKLVAVTTAVTPVLQKAEKCQIYQEIGGCYKTLLVLSILVSVGAF